MFNKLRYFFTFVFVLVFFNSCFKASLDLASYKKKHFEKFDIPSVCKPLYKIKFPKITVYEFNNNSTFSQAVLEDFSAKYSKSGELGVGMVKNGFGAFARSDGTLDYKKVKRDVKSKISESLAISVESILSSMGGVQVYSRMDMQKIIKEQSLQDSGLLNDETLINLGKLSGVRYIITGSLNNVSYKLRDNSKLADTGTDFVKDSDNDNLKIAAFALQALSLATDGTIINISLNIRMLDVETGKILFSEDFEESHNAGKVKNVSFDHIVGGVKDASTKAIKKLVPKLSEYFTLRAYIKQIRSKGKDKIVQLNLGRKDGIKEGQIFKVLALEELKDSFSDESICETYKLGIVLEASKEISNNSSWFVVKEGVDEVKLNQLVQKENL